MTVGGTRTPAFGARGRKWKQSFNLDPQVIWNCAWCWHDYNLSNFGFADTSLGLTIDEAARETKKLKKLFKQRADAPAIFAEWERLVIKHRVVGKPTHDARLVAAMVVHNLMHILTFNTDDFKRFSGITAVNPADVK